MSEYAEDLTDDVLRQMCDAALGVADHPGYWLCCRALGLPIPAGLLAYITQEHAREDLRSISGDIDMGGPEDDVLCPHHCHCHPGKASHMCWHVDRSRECPSCRMPARDPWGEDR